MLFSIIIITLNEQDNIEFTIKCARNAAKVKNNSLPVEIIVCDGGSKDSTVEIAKQLADKTIISEKGRYIQLNSGAKVATGDILVFLHADTFLPEGAILRIFRKMKDPCIIGGGFKKKWKWSEDVKLTSFMKSIFYIWSGFGNWIVRLLKIFPGDNVIFVRKSVYEKIGGYSPLWLCEDFDMSLRLKRYARKRTCNSLKQRSKYIYLRPAVQTSTRRFEKYGFFKTFFNWFFIYWIWRLGRGSNKLKTKFGNYPNFPEKGEKKLITS